MDDLNALRFAFSSVPGYDDPKYASPRIAKCAFKVLEEVLKQDREFVSTAMRICIANKTIGKLKYKVEKKAD
jgi:hypothetical protein